MIKTVAAAKITSLAALGLIIEVTWVLTLGALLLLKHVATLLTLAIHAIGIDAASWVIIGATFNALIGSMIGARFPTLVVLFMRTVFPLMFKLIFFVGKGIDEHVLTDSMYASWQNMEDDHDIMNSDEEFQKLLAACTGLDVAFAPLFVLANKKRVHRWHYKLAHLQHGGSSLRLTWDPGPQLVST